MLDNSVCFGKVVIFMTRDKLKSELLREYPYRIELHAHTMPASACSEVSPEEVIATYAALQYDAVVITNHFMRSEKEKAAYLDAYMADFEQAKEAGERCGLRVILGAEIRFAENTNDYLIYGVTRDMLGEIYDRLSYGVDAFRKEYAMPNSLFIQAHPCRDGIKKVDPLLLDGVEVFNLHPNHNSRIGLAAKLVADSPHLLVTTGTDFHHPNRNHEGVSALRSKTLPEDSFALSALLKENDYLFEVGMNHLVLP